jgi:hypothetical protein
MENEAPPTVRQIYALAAVLCAKAEENFPATRAKASALIERLRTEQGHPAPRLEDVVLRRGSRSGPRPRGTEKLASAIAARLAEELR